MKLASAIVHQPRQAGILLMECLIYMGVFVIILAGAMTTFYYCWDNSKAMVYTTDDITQVLRAGERWRADVRAATGPLTVQATLAGDVLEIPARVGSIRYQLAGGEIRRAGPSTAAGQPVLARVRASTMQPEPRGAVSAWRWNVVLEPRRQQVHLPLQFTFEAVPAKP